MAMPEGPEQYKAMLAMAIPLMVAATAFGSITCSAANPSVASSAWWVLAQAGKRFTPMPGSTRSWGARRPAVVKSHAARLPGPCVAPKP